MRLQKVLQGVLSVAFFLFLCQTGYLIVFSYGLVSVCNTFGAFDIPLAGPFFFIGIGAALFFFGVQWWKEKDVFSAWAWLLLFSGGLSNVYERIMFGCVTDYIHLWLFPAFNIADILLTMGVIGILSNRFLKKKEKVTI